MPRGRKPAEPMPEKLEDRPAWYDRKIAATKERVNKLNEQVALLEEAKKQVEQQIEDEKYHDLIKMIRDSGKSVEEWEYIIKGNLK